MMNLFRRRVTPVALLLRVQTMTNSSNQAGALHPVALKGGTGSLKCEREMSASFVHSSPRRAKDDGRWQAVGKNTK